jgi:DNA-binding CsgD family transcriptional regulator
VARLSEADYKGALEVVSEGVVVEGSMPFPKPVLEALRRLVQCDVVAYHDAPIGRPAAAFVGEPRGEVTGTIRAAEVRYLHQDPLTSAEGACKFSDFLTRPEFHRLEFYREVAAPLGVEDMMRLWLDPAGARLEFDRPDRGFSERDRAVLDLLIGPLRRLRELALRRTRATARDLARTLTPRELDVLMLVAQGRTNRQVAGALWLSSGTVRKHLENIYAKLDVHTRTAAVAWFLTSERAETNQEAADG